MSIRDYTLIEIIGKGVFGDVWLAYQNNVNNEKDRTCQQKTNTLASGFDSGVEKAKLPLVSEVAVKIYKKEFDKCKRYEKSLKLAKELVHPNLIKIYDYFSDRTSQGINSLKFICVMEYVDGFNIGIVPDIETKMALYIPQLKSLFNYLKEIRVLHRDIKPENLMVTTAQLFQDNNTNNTNNTNSNNEENNNVIKLIDYDFLKIETNELYNTVGTPLFCAPEVYAGKPFTHKSDLWSLGATLYYALTKLHPFDAEDYHSLKMLLISDVPPDYSPVPSTYVPILSSLLQKDVELREFP